MAKRVTKTKEPHFNKLICSKDFGELVRYRRTMLGLTMQTTAELCNINDRTLSKIEKGNKAVGLNNALLVANALGIDISFKIRGEDNE